MKQKIKIEIGGTKLEIKTDASINHIRKLENEINQRFNEIQSSSKTRLPSNQIFALLMIEFVDALQESQTQYQNLEKRVVKIVQEAINRIDSHLKKIN